MITIYPRGAYDCVTGYFEDTNGRVKFHLHIGPNGIDPRLRQLEIRTTEAVVLALDLATERLECDV